MTTGTMQEKVLHVNQLIAAYNIMYRNGDYNHAYKIKDLYDKYRHQQKSISFVGHFSAGKSSFINAIMDEDILPQSPIPTSANIVRITSGEGNVKIFFNEKQKETYNEPYDMDMIKDYCMKKGTISRIEISTSNQTIPEKWALYDTPGIDAADDADRLITESSLHLVDLFVYIMDYNHVQSEANMHFLQHIQRIGIPFFIIINQVDKHDDSELPFSQFQEKVKQTFDQWHVRPQHLFYTSMLEKDLSYNQFNQSKQMIFDFMQTWDESEKTIERSFVQVIEDHKTFLQSNYEKNKAEIGDIPDVDAQSLEEVQTDLKELARWPEHVYDSFQTALKSSLRNAYVMPATLRDKAEAFLESQQNDFKVGIFNSKKKTDDERQKRTEDFLADLNESIQATIQWKIRDKFQSLLTENAIHDTGLMDKTNHLSLKYSKDDLHNQLKTGAKVNGNYVLKYTDDVASDVKQRFKMNTQPFLDTLYNTLINRIQDEMENEQREEKRIRDALEKREWQAALTKTYHEKTADINKALEPIEVTEEESAFIEKDDMIERNESISTDAMAHEPLSEQHGTMPVEEHMVADNVAASFNVDHVVDALERTKEIIANLPGFQSYRNELVRKQSKLQDRHITVALFGAFSAGKSSFANALLGESVLPSSPQPTTAVINRILPVTDTHPHGSVLVQYKDESTLMDDIQDVVEDYSPQEDTLDGLIQWVEKNGIQNDAELSDVYRSYLQALLTGYQSAQSFLGEQISLSLAELDDYLTVESVSCFLEVVDVHYQCALTEEGVTLVDTPGADSVNRRHTNVAFDYIKHADAIFYVTYYNHALSRADKAFLMQLGRVKDVFQLDKMFFILNAVDLARSDADLKLVERYVHEQLTALGIRFPTVFPLSSKQALLNKQKKTVLPESMRHFEDMFHEFISHDLPALSIQSAIHDIKRVYQAVESYLENVELNQEEKTAKQAALHHEQEAFQELVNNQKTSVMEQQLVQKIEKQLYYVQERMDIAFHDLFKNAFNPTSITESGKAGQKQLEKSLHHLLNDVRFELFQEIQAVSLRVEAYIQTLLDDFYEGISQHAQAISNAFSLPKLEKSEFETPAFGRAFNDLDIKIFHSVFSMYKGTRSFFVKNEKESFKEALYAVLKPVIHDYVMNQQNVMVDTYRLQLTDAVQSIASDLNAEVEQHVKNHIAMLSDTIDKTEIIHKQRELEAILS